MFFNEWTLSYQPSLPKVSMRQLDELLVDLERAGSPAKLETVNEPIPDDSLLELFYSTKVYTYFSPESTLQVAIHKAINKLTTKVNFLEPEVNKYSEQVREIKVGEYALLNIFVERVTLPSGSCDNQYGGIVGTVPVYKLR